MDVSNSVALVTGANRGIGRALVRALLAEGAAKVYAACRHPAVMAADHARVVPIELDLTDPSQIAEAVDVADDVTFLVNNAGALTFGNILDCDAAAVRRDMETNYFGTLAVTRAFAPVIDRRGGGAVVNLLTIVALASMPGLAAYNASKAAAWSLTQSLRADLAKKNISVHGVYPGPVDTDMLREVDMAKADPADVAAAIIAGVKSGAEDIFPDAVSQDAYAAWRTDHKAVERQFAVM